jgi:hypothetical protein
LTVILFPASLRAGKIPSLWLGANRATLFFPACREVCRENRPSRQLDAQNSAAIPATSGDISIFPCIGAGKIWRKTSLLGGQEQGKSRERAGKEQGRAGKEQGRAGKKQRKAGKKQENAARRQSPSLAQRVNVTGMLASQNDQMAKERRERNPIAIALLHAPGGH